MGADLEKRGVILRTLTEGIDYSTPLGKVVAGIFGLLALYERSLTNERAADAGAAAKVRGRHTGRPKALNVDQTREVRSLRAGVESLSELSRSFRISRVTVYRGLGAV